MIHIAKLSGGAFCGDKRIDIFNTVTYFDREKCTCKNCLQVLRKIDKFSINNLCKEQGLAVVVSREACN